MRCDRRVGVSVLVVILTAVAGCDSDPGPAAPAASDSPSASSPASPTASASPSPTGPPASLPDRYVAAADDDLVVDGVASSAPRTLARFDAPPDPTAPPEEPGSYLAGVELSPDGTVVYADECCEPAAGRTVAYPVDGSGPEERPVLSGGFPAVSWDGRTIAGVALEMVVTGVLDQREERGGILLAAPPELDRTRSSPAWSPDGGLAFLETAVSEAEPDGPSRIVLLGPRARPPLPTFAPPEGTTYAAPAFRADGMLVVARQPVDPTSQQAATGVVLDPADGRFLAEFALDGRVVDQDYDRTGTFLLTTYDGGRLAWQGAGRSGVLRTSGVTAAAW